jgi:hypothetical protein
VGPQAQSPIGVQNEALDFALIQDSKMTGKFTGRHSTHMAGLQLGGRWRYRSPCRRSRQDGPLFRGPRTPTCTTAATPSSFAESIDLGKHHVQDTHTGEVALSKGVTPLAEKPQEL